MGSDAVIRSGSHIIYAHRLFNYWVLSPEHIHATPGVLSADCVRTFKMHVAGW
jgi:hypothetical protein